LRCRDFHRLAYGHNGRNLRAATAELLVVLVDIKIRSHLTSLDAPQADFINAYRAASSRCAVQCELPIMGSFPKRFGQGLSMNQATTLLTCSANRLSL